MATLRTLGEKKSSASRARRFFAPSPVELRPDPELIQQARDILAKAIEISASRKRSGDVLSPDKSLVLFPAREYLRVRAVLERAPYTSDVRRSLSTIGAAACHLRESLEGADQATLEYLDAAEWLESASMGGFGEVLPPASPDEDWRGVIRRRLFEHHTFGEGSKVDATEDFRALLFGKSSVLGGLLRLIEEASERATNLTPGRTGGRTKILVPSLAQRALVEACGWLFRTHCPSLITTSGNRPFRMFVERMHQIATGDPDAIDCEAQVRELCRAYRRGDWPRLPVSDGQNS